MSRNVLLLPGDGIGPEIVAEAEKVLNKVNDQFNLGLTFDKALVGGAAIDATDSPLGAGWQVEIPAVRGLAIIRPSTDLGQREAREQSMQP